MTLREVLEEVFRDEELSEATRATIGRFTARRDQPHFQGDEKHAHVEDGKHEYSWTQSGKRKHPGKFGTDAPPKDAKLAAAKVLDIDPDLLEMQLTPNEVDELLHLLEIDIEADGE